MPARLTGSIIMNTAVDNPPLLSGLAKTLNSFGPKPSLKRPECIAIGLAVFIRHENVLRPLEFLGYRVEAEGPAGCLYSPSYRESFLRKLKGLEGAKLALVVMTFIWVVRFPIG